MKELSSVSGKLKLLAIIGDPIAQVSAPLMINAALQHQQIPDTLMVPLHVAPDQLHHAIEGLRAVQNFAGAIITMPHKKALFRLLDTASVSATACGACNVIRRNDHGEIHGDMLDGEGFVSSLQKQHINVEGKRVYLAGAGGAGTAIAHALAAHQVANLVIYNRNSENSRYLIRQLSGLYPNVPILEGGTTPEHNDIVINATSVGMGENQNLPFLLDNVNLNTIICDIVIYPEKTALLNAAEQRGLRTHSGRAMLTAQIDLMLDFMLGRT